MKQQESCSQYVTDLKAGDGRAGCNPSVVLESDNFVIVDGDRGFGHVVAEYTMGLLAEKARKSSVALSAIRNCHHTGRLGGWGEALARDGLMSLHFLTAAGKGIFAKRQNSRPGKLRRDKTSNHDQAFTRAVAT